MSVDDDLNDAAKKVEVGDVLAIGFQASFLFIKIGLIGLNIMNSTILVPNMNFKRQHSKHKLFSPLAITT